MTEHWEPLHRAAAEGDIDELRSFLDNGADPNSTNPIYGNTLLYSACFRDQAEVVRLLVARGAAVNQRIKYRSPVDGRVEEGVVALMLARSVDVLDALLEAGADPNLADGEGRTVLMRVATFVSPQAVQALIKAGADPTARDQGGLRAADIVHRRLDWLLANSPDPQLPSVRRGKQRLESVLAILESATGEATHRGSRRAVEQ
jgi:ankyrin repeat protein